MISYTLPPGEIYDIRYICLYSLDGDAAVLLVISCVYCTTFDLMISVVSSNLNFIIEKPNVLDTNIHRTIQLSSSLSHHILPCFVCTFSVVSSNEVA